LRPQLIVNLAGHQHQQQQQASLTHAPGSTGQRQTAAPLQAELASQAERLQAAAQVVTEEGLKRPVWQWEVQRMSAPQQNGGAPENGGSSTCTVRVSCMDARRLLAGAFLAEQTYDLIDIDR
jgi:hypothetical protein